MKKIINSKQDIEFHKVKLDDIPVDGTWCINYYKIPTKRRVNQNAMYWAWMSYLSEYYTLTKDDKTWYHEGFKEKFLQPQKINRFGREVEFYTTKDMQDDEFSSYMKNVYDDMLQFGVTLPKKVGKGYDQLMEIYG